eukprot:270072-Ditylum_brightwellii.AAC.1
MKKEFEIIEMLVCFNLMKESMDGKTMAHHLLDTLISTVNKDPTNWFATIIDKSSVNQKSIVHIKSKQSIALFQYPVMHIHWSIVANTSMIQKMNYSE